MSYVHIVFALQKLVVIIVDLKLKALALINNGNGKAELRCHGNNKHRKSIQIKCSLKKIVSSLDVGKVVR